MRQEQVRGLCFNIPLTEPRKYGVPASRQNKKLPLSSSWYYHLQRWCIGEGEGGGAGRGGRGEGRRRPPVYSGRLCARPLLQHLGLMAFTSDQSAARGDYLCCAIRTSRLSLVQFSYSRPVYSTWDGITCLLFAEPFCFGLLKQIPRIHIGFPCIIFAVFSPCSLNINLLVQLDSCHEGIWSLSLPIKRLLPRQYSKGRMPVLFLCVFFYSMVKVHYFVFCLVFFGISVSIYI